MSPPKIISLQNPRVKEAVKLRDRRGRDKQRRILIEGVREITLALEAGIEITEVFVCDPLCTAGPAAELVAELRRQKQIALLSVSEPVMLKLAFGKREEGLLAVARPPERSLEDILKQHVALPPLMAIVDGIEKPGNLGAVLRTADAAGVSGLVVADGGTDLFNPNAIRASLGAIFTLPVCTATTHETLAWLRTQSLRIFTARVAGGIPFHKADFRSGCAIVLGSEARGLSTLWTGDDVTAISLPMLGSVDSLNLSATAAILFYEALRQRNAPAPKALPRG